ncbi:MAG: OmpA family protein [Candidatus Kapabacteria bacterium]|nr:OmpA family protein [Candidatus Kapabacteria bacterium]
MNLKKILNFTGKCALIAISAAIIFLLNINQSRAQEGSLLSTVISLTGNAINEITGDPVTAFITIFDTDGKKVNGGRSDATNGGYYFITGLKPGKTYTVEVKQKNYFIEKFVLAISKDERTPEVSHDILMKPLSVGTAIKLRVPPFELNKSKLRVGSEIFLENIKSALMTNPTVKIEISCYPDNASNLKINKELTEERAKALMAYFTSAGITADRIMSSHGNEKIDPNPKNSPPTGKSAKGKRYIGTSYIIVRLV